MVQVSAATLYHGRSHINPSQRSKVSLLTDHGKKMFTRKTKLYAAAEKSGNLDFYKTHLSREMQDINRELSHFLRDEEMSKQYKMNDEDEIGWKVYRELSDEYTVINYFLHKDEKPNSIT